MATLLPCGATLLFLGRHARPDGGALPTTATVLKVKSG